MRIVLVEDRFCFFRSERSQICFHDSFALLGQILYTNESSPRNLPRQDMIGLYIDFARGFGFAVRGGVWFFAGRQFRVLLASAFCFESKGYPSGAPEGSLRAASRSEPMMDCFLCCCFFNR
jgi:hypothetical protein